jgi:hypothetical protein
MNFWEHLTKASLLAHKNTVWLMCHLPASIQAIIEAISRKIRKRLF